MIWWIENEREIEFDSADMYIVYRTIRENPEGISQHPEGVEGGNGS